MVTASTLRVIVWVAGVTVAGSAFGMEWATQQVSGPLWAWFVLTFVPTVHLIQGTQDLIDAAVDRVTPQTGSDSGDIKQTGQND